MEACWPKVLGRVMEGPRMFGAAGEEGLATKGRPWDSPAPGTGGWQSLGHRSPAGPGPRGGKPCSALGRAASRLPHRTSPAGNRREAVTTRSGGGGGPDDS